MENAKISNKQEDFIKEDTTDVPAVIIKNNNTEFFEKINDSAEGVTEVQQYNTSKIGNKGDSDQGVVKSNEKINNSNELNDSINLFTGIVETNTNKSTVDNLPNNVDKNIETLNEAVVKIPLSLCADYRSDSETDSVDSESDSTTSTSDTSSSESDDEDTDDSGTFKCSKTQNSKKSKTDFSLSDLPPIEDLKISVPEDACVEIGTITSIVDTLVVVESYKGTAALDIDTVLFLDNGKRSLGRIFDILGPISEPVYAVRFNSQIQINENGVAKGLKVYYAPKTPHTSFVFLSEVMKNKGSDASWTDNIEAPSEFQDFSDDEEENRCKNRKSGEFGGEGCKNNSNSEYSCRKRAFNGSGGARRGGNILRPSRFKDPQSSPRGRPGTSFGRFPGPFGNPHAASATPFPPRPQTCSLPPLPMFPFNMSPCPGSVHPPPLPPHMYFTPRFSGPPFPSLGPLPFPGQNFQRPAFQQRTHSVPESYGVSGQRLFSPPPPPPPPSSKAN